VVGLALIVLTTTVQESEREDGRSQYRTTIQKQLAEALGLSGGDEIEWRVAAAGALRIDKK
jgi:hypothetical protein